MPRPSPRPLAEDGADAFAHRAEVDGHVGGVGDEAAVAVEDRAGEVEPLADVDRRGAVLERAAHFLGDRHEQAVEDFEADGVGMGEVVLRRSCNGGSAGAGEKQGAFVLDLGAPSGLDDGRRQRVDDDRGARDGAAGAEGAALVERDAMFGAGEPRGDRFGCGLGRRGRRRDGRGRVAGLGQLDADAVDDEIGVRGIAEALAEGGRERRRDPPPAVRAGVRWRCRCRRGGRRAASRGWFRRPRRDRRAPVRRVRFRRRRGWRRNRRRASARACVRGWPKALARPMP